MRTVPPLLILVCAWALWSGHTEPLIMGFGAVSCLGVHALARRMDRHDGTTGFDFGLIARSVLYVPWLTWEIVKANLDVARRVLSPDPGIHSHLIRTRASQETELGRVIYANSITLTPGTITLDLRGSQLLVHALTREAAAIDEGAGMDLRVARLEGVKSV